MKKQQTETSTDTKIKTYLDMIAPSIVKFNTDHFICGNTFRSVQSLREYPTATDEQAILRHLSEKDGVSLRIYTRQVTSAEEKKIISNAANKNKMNRANTNDLQQTVTAESNLQDVANLVANMHRNREPLLHCATHSVGCACISAEMSGTTSWSTPPDIRKSCSERRVGDNKIAVLFMTSSTANGV